MRSTELGLGLAAGALLAPHGTVGTHVPFPLGSVPRLLVPRYPAAAAAAAVHRYTVPESVRARAGLALASGAARIGAVRIVPGALALGGPGTFIDHLKEVLSRDDLSFAVHLGPPRANRKPVLHVMDMGGNSLAYVKMGANDYTCERVRREARALSQLMSVATPGLVTPPLIAAGAWHEVDYLIMEPLRSGAPRVPDRSARVMAIESLVSAFPVGESRLVDATWWSRAMVELSRSGTDDGRRLRHLADALLMRNDDRPIALGAAHGDWSRWNVSMDGDQVFAWDWERFAIDVPLGWDEVHFTLGAHPGGPSAALDEFDMQPRFRGWPDDREASEFLLATYLICRGASRLAGEEETGVRASSLSKWLIPAAEKLVR